MITILPLALAGLLVGAPAIPTTGRTTVKVSAPTLSALRMRDTLWIGWHPRQLGKPTDGWILQGRSGQKWVPVLDRKTPLFFSMDTTEQPVPMCPPGLVPRVRAALTDPRGGLHLSSEPMSNAKLQAELAKAKSPMEQAMFQAVPGMTSKDPLLAANFGVGAVLPDPDATWNAFRIVSSKTGKTIAEGAVVASDFRVDSIREVRMVPDQAGMGVSLDVEAGSATLESRTPDPTQFTLYRRAWSSGSQAPGLEESLWIRDSSGRWEALRRTGGMTTPLDGRDFQTALSPEESIRFRKATHIAFGYAILSRLDIQRIEIPASQILWEKP